MKISEQVFCKCGKGRSFFQGTGTKKEVPEWKAEWLETLASKGWREINLMAGKAEKCNICNEQKSPCSA